MSGKLGHRQQAFVDWMRENGDLTLTKAAELWPLYHNTKFHHSCTLRRLMKRGIVTRVKRGVYRLGREEIEQRGPEQGDLL